jgi:hypothetical protein
MKKNEPLHNALAALPLKYQELLQRLAIKDRREEWAELLWLIEEYANGKLTHDERNAKPRVSLADGRAQFPDSFQVRAMPSQELPIDPSSHRD